MSNATTLAKGVLNAFVGLGETILMIQRPLWNVLNTAIAAGVAVGASLMLIPRYGPLGAALGMLLPYAVQGVLRWVRSCVSWAGRGHARRCDDRGRLRPWRSPRHCWCGP